MIIKRDKTTDITSEVAQGKQLRKRILQLAEEAGSRFMDGESLNQIVALIAKREKFNQLQIQRLVEETNTVAYNKKYATMKSGNDRRISFELAELGQVVKAMGPDAPPAEDNPNWVKGRPGEGEITKTASTNQTETKQLHNPNNSISKSRERLLAKQAKAEQGELEKQAKKLNREIESGIFKIAQSLVQSEKVYKNANEVFNTMLSEGSFSDTFTDGIIKKASEIAGHLKDTRRVNGTFNVDLSINLSEKVASTLLGKYSLTKTAEESQLVKEPKVMPIHDIGDYHQLISLAKQIQQKQEDSLEIEQKIH